MSTSAAAKKTPIFLKEDEIRLLKSMLEKTEYPEFKGNYGKDQIENKQNRMKQKYSTAVRMGNFDCFKNDLEVLNLSRMLWDDKKKKRNEKEKEGMIRWSDYPHVMKHVPAGTEDIYKHGLELLDPDVVTQIEREWVELELEEAALLANQQRIN